MKEGVPRDMRKLLGMIRLLSYEGTHMSCVYTYVKTYHILYFKYVQFTIQQLIIPMKNAHLRLEEIKLSEKVMKKHN
jgi:hypothetical protein